MTTAPPATPGEDTDVRDPGWLRVGHALKEDRIRRGLERSHIVARVVAQGGQMSQRVVAQVEQGRIQCKGGASVEAACRVWTALGWTGNLVARIQVDGHPLPPLPDPRAPKRVHAPAASLTSRLRTVRSSQLAELEGDLDQVVDRVRTDLIRLGVGMTALDGDTASHHRTATRAARQIITAWVDRTIAELEDSDRTGPYDQGQ